MAKGKKTGGRNFQVGNKANPHGRPAIAGDELREAKIAFRNRFESYIVELSSMSFEELNAVMKDPQTPALKLMIVSVILKGASLGDPGRMTFLLDRLVGSVPKAVELSGAQGQPLSPLMNFTTIELTSMLGEIQKLIKEKGCSPQKALPPSASSVASFPRGSPTGS
jgi:hypothetical protein